VAYNMYYTNAGGSQIHFVPPLIDLFIDCRCSDGGD